MTATGGTSLPIGPTVNTDPLTPRGAARRAAVEAAARQGAGEEGTRVRTMTVDDLATVGPSLRAALRADMR